MVRRIKVAVVAFGVVGLFVGGWAAADGGSAVAYQGKAPWAAVSGH